MSLQERDQKGIRRKCPSGTLDQLLEGWWRGGISLSLSSWSFPSASSLLPHPAMEPSFVTFWIRTHTHTQTHKRSQLQGSKFQIWLHLEAALCQLLMETCILPQNSKRHIKNTVFISHSYKLQTWTNRKSLSRKRPVDARHSVGCRGKMYSLLKKVTKVHEKGGDGLSALEWISNNKWKHFLKHYVISENKNPVSKHAQKGKE